MIHEGLRNLALLATALTDLRGGDIDLLIELPAPTADKLSVSLRAGAKLQLAIGERKIDVLVTDPETTETALIRRARAEGICL